MKNHTNNRSLRVHALASAKVHPAFKLLAKHKELQLWLSDWSPRPRRIIREIRAMAAADLVYCHSPANLRIALLPIARLLGKPVILQWIGGDVLKVTARKRPPINDMGTNKNISAATACLSGVHGLPRLFAGMVIAFPRLFLFYLARCVTRHYACAPTLVKELDMAGVSAAYLPVLHHIPADPQPLPPEWRILTYIGFHANADTRDFYGWQTVLRLAADYPDLRIDVVGRGAALGDVPPNIRCIGYVDDIPAVLKKVRGLLRITYHDGMPRMILEALALGRYVICNISIPETRTVINYEETARAIEELREATAPNYRGADYIRQHFHPLRLMEEYVRIFNDTAGKSCSDKTSTTSQEKHHG